MHDTQLALILSRLERRVSDLEQIERLEMRGGPVTVEEVGAFRRVHFGRLEEEEEKAESAAAAVLSLKTG